MISQRYRQFLTVYMRVLDQLSAWASTRAWLIGLLILSAVLLWMFVLNDSGSVARDPVTTRCADFATWQDAVDYWDVNNDHPLVRDGLDSNANGVPCETMVDFTGLDLPPVDMQVVCDDFDHWDLAQRYFEKYVEEWPELRSLDGDNNGIACQEIPSIEDIVAVVKRLNRLESEGLR